MSMNAGQEAHDDDGLDAATRVLVVDDDEANLIAIRAVLAELGHPIVTARSGEEALRRLLREDYAVILLDVRMPGMDGYETAELIRGRHRSRDVPIIFLSGIDKDETHLFRGYAAGAVDYVFKPIEPVILRSKVAVLAQLARNAAEIRRKAAHEQRLLAENLEVRAREAKVARELEQSLRQQSLVLQALPIALFVSRSGDDYRQRSFVGGNVERLCGIAGNGDGRAAGAQWFDQIHPDDASRLRDAIEGTAESGSYDVEYRIRCGDGTYRWLHERAERKTDDGTGELLGIITDISERKRLEEQLTHAQKLEAVGRMSGGIAHDFNNMLSVIVGSIDRVVASEQLSPKGQQRLSLATQAVNSCADLTKRLLGFARRQALEPRDLDIATELEQLRALFARMLGETVSTVTECAENTPHVFVDPSQLESAIVNLVVNARDAMEEGGTLTISAAPVSLGGREAAEAGLAPGEFVRLSVADTGCGMDETTRLRALEPFFTTKGPDRGTGLGLSTIYGFVRQSGGGVRIESTVGTGTVVHLYLPSAGSRQTTRRDPVDTAAPFDLGGTRVLLVEDNEQVRETAASMLEALGCEVTAAGDASEALNAFAPDRFDLLFTDCVMPGELDGPRLASVLKKENPALAILLTSGYHETTEPLPPGSAGFLRKPYSEDQLRDAIRQLIAGNAGRRGPAEQTGEGRRTPAKPEARRTRKVRS